MPHQPYDPIDDGWDDLRAARAARSAQAPTYPPSSLNRQPTNLSRNFTSTSSHSRARSSSGHFDVFETRSARADNIFSGGPFEQVRPARSCTNSTTCSHHSTCPHGPGFMPFSFFSFGLPLIINRFLPISHPRDSPEPSSRGESSYGPSSYGRTGPFERGRSFTRRIGNSRAEGSYGSTRRGESSRGSTRRSASVSGSDRLLDWIPRASRNNPEQRLLAAEPFNSTLGGSSRGSTIRGESIYASTRHGSTRHSSTRRAQSSQASTHHVASSHGSTIRGDSTHDSTRRIGDRSEQSRYGESSRASTRHGSTRSGTSSRSRRNEEQFHLRPLPAHPRDDTPGQQWLRQQLNDHAAHPGHRPSQLVREYLQANGYLRGHGGGGSGSVRTTRTGSTGAGRGEGDRLPLTQRALERHTARTGGRNRSSEIGGTQHEYGVGEEVRIGLDMRGERF